MKSGTPMAQRIKSPSTMLSKLAVEAKGQHQLTRNKMQVHQAIMRTHEKYPDEGLQSIS